MSIKSIFKVIKGLFKGEIPGYIKIKVANEGLKVFEDGLWDNLSQTDLEFVAKSMLHKLHIKIYQANGMSYHTDTIKNLERTKEKLISDIKKLKDNK